MSDERWAMYDGSRLWDKAKSESIIVNRMTMCCWYTMFVRIERANTAAFSLIAFPSMNAVFFCSLLSFHFIIIIINLWLAYADAFSFTIISCFFFWYLNGSHSCRDDRPVQFNCEIIWNFIQIDENMEMMGPKREKIQTIQKKCSFGFDKYIEMWLLLHALKCHYARECGWWMYWCMMHASPSNAQYNGAASAVYYCYTECYAQCVYNGKKNQLETTQMKCIDWHRHNHQLENRVNGI